MLKMVISHWASPWIPLGTSQRSCGSPSWWEGGCCPLPSTPPPAIGSWPNGKSWARPCGKVASWPQNKRRDSVTLVAEWLSVWSSYSGELTALCWMARIGWSSLAQGCHCALPLHAWAGHFVAAAYLLLVLLYFVIFIFHFILFFHK